MINPVGGGGINFHKSYEKSLKRVRSNSNINPEEGVVIDLPKGGSLIRETAEEKVERLKKLIREGNYPLDRSKLAERILDFLTDGG
jgi:anti-sigma28 factor (negative regulator of flagellin synthesis)